MHQFNEWQSSFTAALLDPERLVPSGLITPWGEPGTKRFGVYRNNVIRGLVEALKDTFPVACRIVGTDFFEAMARIYAFRNPPRSPILLEYGLEFAQFVAGFGPADCVPYLGDVCRIERSWLEAYHAPDGSPLDQGEMGSLSTADCARLCLDLHPSVRLVSSRFPVVTIWSTNIEGAEPVQVDLDAGGEHALIARPFAEVDLFGLSDEEMAFTQAIAAGSAIVSAAQSALELAPEFNVDVALRNLLQMGIVANYRVVSTIERRIHD